MLDSLRNSASSWTVKILLGILVLSFAVWGVGDIFRNFDRQKLAEVGGIEITMPEFERAYQNQINAVSNQLGRQLTSVEARSLGLPQRVLQNLVGETAVNIHATKLGLGIQEKTVVDSVTNEPSFAGSDGKFDRRLFDQVLRNINMREQTFLAFQRRDMIRNQIAGTLTAALYVPQTMVDAVNRYQNDQRALKFFILPATAAGTVPAPDEAALKTYYDEHKSTFKAPEFRKIGMLLLSSDTVKDAVAVSDEDIKAAYDANKKKYGTPEERTIKQLIFKDKAAANAAHQKLAKGADFVKLGEELGMKEADIDLGTFAKDKMADAKIAEAAFKLEKGKPSAVVEGFSPVILLVTEIKPGTQKPLDEVKTTVRDELAKARAAEAIAKLYDQIEDGRGGGAALTEIAKKMNLKYEELTFDIQGRGTDGEKLANLAKAPEVIKLSFDSDVGVENNPLSVTDGYAFVEVREVIPERQKPLAEVQENVKKAWTDAETLKRIEAKSGELMARATGGEKIETLAEAVKTTVTQTKLLKRTEVQPGLPVTAIAQAFTLGEGAFGSAQTPDRKSRVIYQVTEIKPAAALDDKTAEALRMQVRSGMGADVLAQYVNGLQNTYGVQVNTKAISELTGQ